MKVKEELFNKNGLAIMKLAGELLRFHSGDRLPNVVDLAKRYNLSVGTTQYGLNFLKEKEVVGLISRGHLGTFIEFIKYEPLQEYAGISYRGCVMPLPYTLRYEGLASAFSELGNESGKFSVAFMNGSGRRVKALLHNRYDCALLSRKASETYCAEGMPLEIAMAFGPGTFLEKHVLVYRTKHVEDIRTLGLDPESLDQVILLKQFLENHPRITVVNQRYTRIVNKLESGDVDATLWTVDYIKEHHLDLKYVSINLPLADSDAMSEAVLVVRSGDTATTNYLKHHFIKEKVLEMQDSVLSGERIPEY